MNDDRKRLVYDVLRRHSQGVSQRQIARLQGIDPKTVRRILKKHQARLEAGDDALTRDLPPTRAPRGSKLDQYSEHIGRLLKDFPDITAQRVLEELTDSGFDGGYTIVREYMRSIRPKLVKRAHDPVHTPPGKQAQCDWSPHTLPGCGDRVQTFSLVLHNSSYQYVDFCRNRTQITLFRQIKKGFEDYDGIPEEVVFDSEKTVVDRWENGAPIINLGMADFAAYYGFSVHIAPRADGAYKGGVERPFRTIEENFFNGRHFKSFEDARERLAKWRDKFALRPHGTKLDTRASMFKEEQPYLKPLPTKAYDTSEVVWRIADGYHRVLFETNTYTVPRAFVGVRLCLRATEDKVEIYDRAIRLLATHARIAHGLHVASELPEHRRPKRIDIKKVIERFDMLGPTPGAFARQLRAQQRRGGVELIKILNLQAKYSLEDVICAIVRAADYNTHRFTAVERILHVQATPLDFDALVARRVRANIRRALAQVPVRQRSLDAYQDLLSSHNKEAHNPEHDAHETQGPHTD